MRVAVLGAGPCGLMTAHELRSAGHDVDVFEASDAVGGMSGSFAIAGQAVDFGSHRLHTATDPNTIEMLRELLGDDLQLRRRNGRIRLQDRWVSFPLRMSEMIRRLPPTFTARTAIGTASRLVRRGPARSFEQAIEQRLGRAVADDFYGPYAQKLYGASPGELTAELADRRVAVGSPLDIVRRALVSDDSPRRQFLYPRLGYGQICEALRDAIERNGVDIRMGEPVTGIDLGEHPVISVGTDSVEADLVVSTLPVSALLRMLADQVPSEVSTSAAALRTRGMVLAYLVLPVDRWTEFDAHYLPEPGLLASRISEPKNYRSNPDDPTDTTVICAEIPCWPGDATWSASPQDIASRIMDDVERIGLPSPRPVDVDVRRLPSVYPVYEFATQASREIVEGWLAEPPSGLISVGRQGLGVPDNLHHVLAMASATAAVVGPTGVDADTWRDRVSGFASNVVED
ncbi:MAG: FAD-dependent oxidoreductase [Actinomycetota bacterium]